MVIARPRREVSPQFPFREAYGDLQAMIYALQCMDKWERLEISVWRCA